MQYRSVECEGENGTVIDKKYCSDYDATLRSRDCEIPCPIDCVMGDWSEWSRCTPDCGIEAKIQRTREIVTPAQNGGRKCPEGSQSRPCGDAPCYGYSLKVGPWEKCYVDGQGCGKGTQRRETNCVRSDGEVVSLVFCFGHLSK